MYAHVGDLLLIEGTHLGDSRRTAVITALRHGDGSPPYEVRWLDDEILHDRDVVRALIALSGEASLVVPAARSGPTTRRAAR